MSILARTVVLAIFTVSLGLPSIAVAAPEQQNKMKACNEQANAKGFGEGKGEERKAFMKECLSAKPAASSKGTQQDKMKTCNKEAGEKKLKGDDRKKFMSDCLSN